MLPDWDYYPTGQYPDQGYTILELVDATRFLSTTFYKIRWHCHDDTAIVTHAALAKRRARLIKFGITEPRCQTCARHANGVLAMDKMLHPEKYVELDSEAALFTPNAPSKPQFLHGVVSAAVAWPVPQMIRSLYPQL